jgi:hypothetical protein
MVANYLDDGVLAYFGYPAAHEDDAERAVRADLASLDVVGTLKPAPDVTLQANWHRPGVVVVGDLDHEGVTQENAAIGETTNLAARLQSVAKPNSIVISPDTHRPVGGLFAYRDLGEQSLKAFAEPLHAYQVLGRSKIESRFEALHQSGSSPLLGREEELDLLLRRWEQGAAGRLLVAKVGSSAPKPAIPTASAVYSTTSSVSASNSGAISSPSALAVLRLITNSNLVGCSTGRSVVRSSIWGTYGRRRFKLPPPS